MSNIDIIPEGVENIQAYKSYIRLSKHKVLQESFYIVPTSDGGEVNIRMLKNQLTDRISHLPEKEQEHILELKGKYQAVHLKRMNLKRKAFGSFRKSASLTQFHSEVCELFGKYHTIKETYDILKGWGLQITPTQLSEFRKANIEAIEELKIKYRSSFENVRLGHKRSRLDEYTELYSKAKKKFQQTENKEYFSQMLKILDFIRKEVEGDIMTVNGKIDVDMELNLQQHINKEVLKTINLKEIVISRVCVRMGIDPLILLYDLNNSFYRKINGVVDEPDFSTDISYPSQQHYDFRQIKQDRNKIESDRKIGFAKISERIDKAKDKARKEERKVKEGTTDKTARQRVLDKIRANIKATQERKSEIDSNQEMK